MRISRKGIATILVFLIAIPFAVDALLETMFSSIGANGRLTKLLSVNYIKAIPWYALYLIVAFTILHFIKVWKRTNKK